MNKDIIRQIFWKLVNKYFGKYCQNCGIKKFHVRRYKGVCSKCFLKYKLKKEEQDKYRGKRSELRHRAHKLVEKIIAKMSTNRKRFNSKNNRRRRLYEWLEKNTDSGHFRDMRSHDEIREAIKKLKKFYRKL